MTFVGKILVFVIMIFAVVFLGISTVVFTANTNWKEATKKEKAKVADVSKKLQDATDASAAAQKELEAAKTQHAQDTQKLNNDIVALQAAIKTAESQTTAARNALGLTQKNMELALDEATAKKAETDQLRVQKSAVDKQANEFKLKQTELLDKIRELERFLETSKANEKDLRDRAGRLSTLLRQRGFSDDVSQVTSADSPPPVEGQVKKVDKANKTVEISIGSDDGLVPGHELYLYRVSPRPEYLGRLKIMSVDPDQAVAKVIKGTVQSKKIQEGDIVSSTFRARG